MRGWRKAAIGAGGTSGAGDVVGTGAADGGVVGASGAGGVGAAGDC